MLRQLRAGLRCPAHSLSSSFARAPLPRQNSSWQRHFSQRRIPRHGPRTGHHRQNKQGPRPLQARIYASIYTSIGYLVINEAISWPDRQTLAVNTVENITMETDVKQKWLKFYAMGEALLEAYSGAEVEYHEDAVRLPANTGWADELQFRILTAPDPEVEGGTLLLCLATLRDPEDTYLNVHSNQLTDAVEFLLPDIEAFASRLEGSPRVRGGMLILQQSGDWKSLYWDGIRWINVVYLEWQTPESISQAFFFDHEEE